MHRGLKSHIMEAFSIFKVSQAAAACKKERKENKHTHSHGDTYKTISLITQFYPWGLRGLSFFFFFLFFSWCFLIGSLPGALGDSRHRSGFPAGPLIFHQPIELKLKAGGKGWRGCPSFYGSLLEPASDCSLFPQIVFHLVRLQRRAALKRWGGVSQTFRGARNSYSLGRWIQ